MKLDEFMAQLELAAIKKEMAKSVGIANSSGRDEFCGLSPNQMSRLLYEFGSVSSPVRVQDDIDNEVLDQIPLFVLMEQLLKIAVRDKGLGLTGLGYIKRKPLLELYELRLIPVKHIEEGRWTMRGELEWPAAGMLHDIARSAGWIRKYKGKLVITKRGEKLLAGRRDKFFKCLFERFTGGFTWPHQDLSQDLPIIQQFCGFTFYLLFLYGESSRPLEFYADKFLTAFPMAIDAIDDDRFETAEQTFARIFKWRIFERFLDWFGMTETVTTHRKFESDTTVVRKPLMEEIVYLNV